MKKKILVVLLPVFLVILFCFIYLPKANSENQSEIDKAISYLKVQPLDPWAIMVLASANETNIDLSSLRSAPAGQKSATAYAKYILALTANGKNSAEFGDENYVEKLKSYFNNNQFGDATLLNDDIWAILALGSLGQENLNQVQKAKDFLLANQNSDGGWSYNVGGSSDVDDSAAAVMALLEAGVVNDSINIQKAVVYLKSSQNSDGGFPYSAGSLTGSLTDSCSNAWVISAIYKLGQNPTDSAWVKDGKNAIQSLLSFQDADGGFWWQANGDNKFCSAFSALALMGQTYPVKTPYNLHYLRIEGSQDVICETQVYGGTAMDLVGTAAKKCGFTYTISEYPGLGLYLAQLNGETSWMYLVNNLPPSFGADSYYLAKDDEVLWYAGEWLDKGWFPTKILVSQSDIMVDIQVQFYNFSEKVWQNLAKDNVKVKVGSSEFDTDGQGKVKIALAMFSDGLYEVFVERQIINGTGYIRSVKEELKIGNAPAGHQVELRATIEKLAAPAIGDQLAISFSVSPDILDFGPLKPGQSKELGLTIANGPADIYLETEVGGSSAFKNNLTIDKILAGDFSMEVAAEQNKSLAVKLAVPLNYQGDSGPIQGGLTFWAIKE